MRGARTGRIALVWAAFALTAVLGAWSGARGQGRPPAAAPRTLGTPERDGPSPIVYPPQRIRLRMNHAHPAHRPLRCVRCHLGAGVSDRASDSLIPDEARCLPCHEDRIARDEPSTEERCGYCHVGFDEDRPRYVPASDFPTARLHFSHRRHVDDGMRCLTCHRGVGSTRIADRRHLPRMRQCFECHGPPGFAAEASAPSSCETCHLSRPDGMLRTRWPEGEMNPPTWLFDMRHDHEWVVRHRWVGADRGSMCAECHQESDCVDCHDGRVRPRSVHPGDYLSTHPAQARRDQPRCTSCHQTARFCTECHARLGLAPQSAPEVRASGRYHPPAAVWVRGPTLHGLEARRAMNACVSCHTERDCVQCHGALGIGAGVSPHPPGFVATCRAHLERNARACETCHGDLDGLRRRCR
ncbi:MAG TPA: cytochrome c3 family protein [Sandaracinaceae bacterium LLY-WYZ-13_1]|nr:cytochrome c3 family protein [Sandaracinaceae bacterium LLY-WYZ-13_1]